MTMNERNGITHKWVVEQSNDTDQAPIINEAVSVGDYTVLPEMIAAGGESQVYRAVRMEDSKPYVAKLFLSWDYRNEQTDSILSRLRENNEHHLMPRYYKGSVVIDDHQIPVEILPFCEKVKQCPYDELRTKVIPDILGAICALHDADLVHGDIKPGNIYRYDEKYILGDFGTARRISDIENIAHTKNQRGTLGYMAPEVYQGVACSESDYYSFGMTIASLYLGHHPHQDILNSTNNDYKKGELFTRIEKEGVPLDAPESEKDLQLLVDALTPSKKNERATKEDVCEWLKDKDSFVLKWKNKHFSMQTVEFSYKFQDEVYTDPKELLHAFITHWNAARDEIFSVGVNNNRFLNAMNRMGHFHADKVEKIIKKRVDDKRGEMDLDLAFAKILYYFCTNERDKACPVFWQGNTYFTLANISVALKQSKDHGLQSDRESLTALIRSGFLSWRIDTELDTDSPVKKKTIEIIETISQKSPEFACNVLMYRCAPSGLFSATNPDEVFKDLTKDATIFYSSVKNIMSVDAFARLACLMDEDGFERLLEVYNKIQSENRFEEKVTALYVLFESICNDKYSVRKRYQTVGPYSYILWLRNNIDKYSVLSDEENKYKKKILELQLYDNDPIKASEEKFKKTYSAYLFFASEFNNDIVVNYISFPGEKGITSNDMMAYFVKSVFSVPVPVGFLAQIGLA